ncbi:entericidin A/B family lipoprotein [Glaciecola sp. 2405UD65-10]
MNKKTTILQSAMCVFLITLAAGCATIEGAGKDIETAGEAVQDAADGE